jgi:hypothetical protein
MPPTLAEAYPARIYPLADGQVLFVPSERMWRLHEASLPTAVAVRAGLGRLTYQQWLRALAKRWPSLPEFLYAPRGVPKGDMDGFKPTPAMLAFRNEASMEAIWRATLENRGADESDKTIHGAVSGWRRTFKGHTWLEPWLFKGQPLPPEVSVVTALQANRCACAWHVGSICKDAGIDSETYIGWIRRRQIPTLSWLKWLFGSPPPEGTFVVDRQLQELRFAMSQECIQDSLGLSNTSFWTWKTSERTKAPFEAIMAGADPAAAEGWNKLTNLTKGNLLRVKAALTLTESIKRSGMSPAAYYQAQREAERRGVTDQLRRYLRMEEPFGERPRCGLVTPDFFIPTAEMIAFREQAVKRGAVARLQAVKDIRGVEDWFLDWVLPRSNRGRRLTVPRDDQVASAAPPGRAGDVGPAARPGSAEKPNGGLTAPAAESAATHPHPNVQPASAGGRARSKETDAVYRFCYERLGKMKRIGIVNKAKAVFQIGAPKEPHHVTTYAKRYAEAHGLPYPPPR